MKLLNEVDSMLEKAFTKNFKGGNIKTGKNHLIMKWPKNTSLSF